MLLSTEYLPWNKSNRLGRCHSCTVSRYVYVVPLKGKHVYSPLTEVDLDLTNP